MYLLTRISRWMKVWRRVTEEFRETGCFSSRLTDERWNAMHLSWRHCFPGNLRQTFIVRRSRLLPLLKLEKRRRGGQVNRKGSRGGGGGSRVRTKRKDGIHILPPTKQTTAFRESFGVAALFVIVGRHKRRECGKTRRKTRVSRTDEFRRFLELCGALSALPLR